MNEFYTPVREAANKIGGDVKEANDLYEKVLSEAEKLITKASGMKKPSDDQIGSVVADLSNAMNAAADLQNKKKLSKEINYLKAYAEAAQLFAWVIDPLPAPFVGQGKGSTEFWSNKILVANKGKDELQAGWARGISEFLKQLQAYTKQWHTQGLKYKA